MYVVVGAAVPAAMRRWGLCSRCPGVGRCLSGVNIIIIDGNESERDVFKKEMGALVCVAPETGWAVNGRPTLPPRRPSAY